MTHQNKEGLEALIDLLKTRDGESFDGEVHLTSAEAQAIEKLVSSLREENERLRKERDQLSDDLYEERQKPWPEWAEKVLKAIRKRSGYDGYDDADGVDLPEELEEAFAELEREADRHTHEVRASKEFKSAKDAADHYRGKVTELCAEITACQAQLKIYREALEKISCPTQTEGLLWWQIDARTALSQEAGE